MTNRNQIDQSVWYYSYARGRVAEAKIFVNSVIDTHVSLKNEDGAFCLERRDGYDTKAEAVEATRAWAEKGIKNLQTILDNLKEA